MIGKLKGIIESVSEDGLLLDVGGVCYLIYLSARSLQQLPEAGHPATIFIETHVREDHIHLYGFLSESEKRWFNVLCTVQGVGAKMGLGILSSFTPLEIVQAIHARDSKLLTRANGVGPKLGERLVTELKNKVDSIPTGDVSFAPSTASTAKPTSTPSATPAAASSEIEEAISALSNLGYGRSEAYSAILALTQEQPDISLEEMIRLSLSKLAR